MGEAPHDLQFQIADGAVAGPCEIRFTSHIPTSPDPHGALATYLHERCHIFGGDGSAGFLAALTDACGRLAAIAHRVVELAHDWQENM